MIVNKNGLDMIKLFEGFSAVPYICAGGRRTIGYGHVILPNENLTTVTDEDATELLKKDLNPIEKELNSLSVSMYETLTQNEFNALASLIINIGLGAFRRSTIRKKLISGADYMSTANEFLRWNKVKGRVNSHQKKRRAKERDVFLVGKPNSRRGEAK